MNYIELIRYPMVISTIILLVLIIEALVKFSLQLRRSGNWYFDKAKVIEYWVIGIFVTTSFMLLNFFDFTFEHCAILFFVIILCGFIRSYRKS
ncbi:MAG: hypothetical protein GXY16_06505 [Syntrophomonadaceae bacterium]|nr:hypothetical protein [Syntrophomonadaceae bacterium]NLT20633.1 hypothetical protein [Syntrophomonadaceae bacterium]